MSLNPSPPLLGIVLDSWDHHHHLLVKLLRALPPGGLVAKATDTSPSVSQMFSHLHHERLISVSEEAPEIGVQVPKVEWAVETDVDRIARMLDESARAVREAVGRRVSEGRDLDRSFAHPLYLIQFLIFHEGYHHGQIKLALKIAGCPLTDEVVGPLIWGPWRERKAPNPVPASTALGEQRSF